MQFSNKKKTVAAAMIAVGGLALVGVGTGAVFTDSVSAQQQIDVGHIDVRVAPANPNDGSASWDGKTVTFNTFGPTGSSFHTTQVNTVITNHGTVKADAIWLKASAVLGPNAAASNAVLDKLHVTITSQNATIYNGLLSALIANPMQVQGPLDLDGNDNFTTEYYVPAGLDSLDSSAQDGTVTPKVTVEYVG
jgi:predicted ribosomally synthesized peptide with SipW-like signal peptide